MCKIWHRERFSWRSLGNSSVETQSLQVSTRTMIGSNLDKARGKHPLAYNGIGVGQTRLNLFTTPTGESEHQNRAWVVPGLVTTQTSAHYRMPS